MERTFYSRGNAMTFPLELAQIKEDEEEKDINYLYPIEVAQIQDMVTNVCDQMEYDGSMMYDCYPDKVTVGRMAKSICSQQRYHDGICSDERWMQPLIDVMLCHEMSCRRWKRKCRRARMD